MQTAWWEPVLWAQLHPPSRPPPAALRCAVQYERHHVCSQLEVTLTALNCRAMVVGHTPQMGGCNCECGGRVWRVDVGMSSGVLNAEPEVLEFRKNDQGHTVVRVLHPGNMLGPKSGNGLGYANGSPAQAA